MKTNKQTKNEGEKKTGKKVKREDWKRDRGKDLSPQFKNPEDICNFNYVLI